MASPDTQKKLREKYEEIRRNELTLDMINQSISMVFKFFITNMVWIFYKLIFPKS